VTHPERTKNRNRGKSTRNTATAAAKLTFAVNAVEQANGTNYQAQSYEAFKVSQIARNQQQHTDASTVHKICAGLHTDASTVHKICACPAWLASHAGVLWFLPTQAVM
jgi:hypothetical protein